jgi:hypothetical protein
MAIAHTFPVLLRTVGGNRQGREDKRQGKKRLKQPPRESDRGGQGTEVPVEDRGRLDNVTLGFMYERG